MAAEQSQFSRLPKKQLVFIAEKLVDEEFPIGNPYDDDFDNAYSILQEVSKYFSVEPTHEDVEFFAKLLEINDEIIADLFANNKEQMKNRELIEQLVIPVAKSYNMDYSSWGTCSYTNYMVQEYENFEESDYSFGDVYEVNESNTRNESVLNRLVIENTSEVVNSLDRKTLLELRRIIDSKLRLL
jgi:hypothetical protein